MKKCPYCAEEIQDAAIFCRYCRRDLPKEGEQSPPVQTPPPELIQPPPPSPVQVPTTESQATGEGAPRERRQRPPLGIGIVVGLVLSLLAAIPRIGVLISFSEQRGDALYFRGLLQDLAFHFFVNWVLLALVSALIVWLWRRSRALLIVLVVFGGGIVLMVALTSGSGALPAVAPPTAIPISQTPVYRPTPTRRIPTPTATPSVRYDCSCGDRIEVFEGWMSAAEPIAGTRVCARGELRSSDCSLDACTVTIGDSEFLTAPDVCEGCPVGDSSSGKLVYTGPLKPGVWVVLRGVMVGWGDAVRVSGLRMDVCPTVTP